MQRISGVDKGSIAEELGIKPGDILLAIDGEPILDVVDYQYFTSDESLLMRLRTEAGEEYEAEVEKEAYEPLGLQFEKGLMSDVRTCRNSCVFCFIDQMPKGGRNTLSFKDDDWRMSFIMGNYVSLTNVSDGEFKRILDRRIGPLYISVHATAPEVRQHIMGNPEAGRIMERLRALFDKGIIFHSQIVCCPGINDGEVLQRSMEELSALRPYARSLAVVPVGLTKYREGLAPLRCFTREEARATLQQIQAFAAGHKERAGSAFVFPSDEFVLLAGEELPAYEACEDFPQIENGVGLLRLFEHDFMEFLKEKTPMEKPVYVDAAGGTLAHAFMKGLFEKLEGYNIHCTAHAIENDFFGRSITVGGLVTGRDIIAQLKGNMASNTLLLPRNMFREQEDVLLDGVTVEELARTLGAHVIPVRGDGDAWVEILFANTQWIKENE